MYITRHIKKVYKFKVTCIDKKNTSDFKFGINLIFFHTQKSVDKKKVNIIHIVININYSYSFLATLII